MNENDIREFIRQTDQDLKLAKDFLAMWQRRNAAVNPALMEQPQPAREPPILNELDSFRDYGANKAAIRKAIEHCPEDYTVHDIHRALVEIGIPMPRAAVSQAMSRMLKNDEVVLAKKGAGRKPSIYRKHEVSGKKTE